MSVLHVTVVCDGFGCSQSIKEVYITHKYESVQKYIESLKWYVSEDNKYHYCPECAEEEGF